MFKDYFTESAKITWEGGSDSYEYSIKIENLIAQYDFLCTYDRFIRATKRKNETK